MKGRALLLCPVRSNVDLLRYGEGIVHIYAEIPDSALYLGVTEYNSTARRFPHGGRCVLLLIAAMSAYRGSNPTPVNQPDTSLP